MTSHGRVAHWWVASVCIYMRLHRLQGPSVWAGTVICDVALWEWAAEGTDYVSPCYRITGCRDVCGIETKLFRSRDGCGNVTELLGAGMVVALWLSYWEQGGTVTELLGAGMAVVLWQSYEEQG